VIGNARRGLLAHDACAEPGADPIHLQARRLVCGLALLACMVTEATTVHAQVLTVRVLRVVDGDTLVVSTADSLNLKVRLQGIDAPECGMPFGPQAQRFLEQLVLGRTVQMTTTGRDRYGRTVATVAVGEQDVGFALLQAGLAWYDRRYDRPRLPAATNQYAAAQQRAALNFTGLWAEPRQTAPWLWRADGSQSRSRPHCIGTSVPQRASNRLKGSWSWTFLMFLVVT
jgi:endonuclease YncB( thermonuclease family)